MRHSNVALDNAILGGGGFINKNNNKGDDERESLLFMPNAQSSSSSSSSSSSWGIKKAVVGVMIVGGLSTLALSYSNGSNRSPFFTRRLGFSESITFEDVIHARDFIQPEQIGMPMHVYSYDPKTKIGIPWTISEVVSSNPAWKGVNVDTRSTGVINFLNAMMPYEFPTLWKPIDFAWATQDYPRTPCVDSANGCGQSKAPVFSFGSVPKDESKIPSLIQAPNVAFTQCIAHAYNPGKYEECDWFASPNTCVDNRMYTGSTASFSSLKPIMFWRGSDWSILQAYPSVGTWSAHEFLQKNNLCGASKEDIYKAVLYSGSNDGKPFDVRVPPRLRAAVRSASNTSAYDIKFTCAAQYAPEKLCIEDQVPTFSPDTATACDFAQYKYLISLGGGGGTSWKSTFEFLGMPGVLFLHETQMKDSFYDSIKAWEHYIPVNKDLTDLDQRLQWARNHEAESEAISKRATAFVKHFMSPEGLKEHATKTMVNPLRQYIEAYANNGENPVAVEELTKKFSSGILNAWRFNPTEEPFLGAKTQ